MTGRRTSCRFGCGATVLRFTDEDAGRLVQLDHHPYRGDMTLPSVRHRLWRYRSVRTGWVPVPYLGEEERVLSHRHAWLRGGHIFTEHDCDKTPKICKPITSVHSAHTTPKPPCETECEDTHDTASTGGPFRPPRIHIEHQVG